MHRDLRSTSRLLDRARVGDSDAIGELLSRHRGWIATLVRRECGPLISAHLDWTDCAQDLAVTLLRSLPRSRVHCVQSFRRFVRQRLRNNLCNAHDRLIAGKRDVTRSAELSCEPVDTRESDPLDTACGEEQASLVRSVLDALADGELTLLRWRFDDDSGFHEIGRRLGVRPDTARMRLNRVLAKVRATVAGRSGARRAA